MMCLSSLNDETTTHTSGYTTMIAQTARNRCEKPLNALSPIALFSFACRWPAPCRAAPGAEDVRLSFTTRSAMSELDSIAAGDPQLDRGYQHGEDRQRDAERTRIAELTALERVELDYRGEDLGGVVGAALAGRHDVDQGEH